MENRYPKFAGGRILKKESLWDLRDYAYDSMKLFYMDYTDGIIRGCQVRVKENVLVIGKGILKYGDFIYLLQEEVQVPFEAGNRLTVLKADFAIKQSDPDYLAYQVRFFLDLDSARQENQIELCRFHLREGSVLRDTYNNFVDMRTEYDTVNLIYATMAGRGQGRLHPKVMMKFVEELKDQEEKNIEDRAFCLHVLQHTGEIEKTVLNAYLQKKQPDRILETELHENIQCRTAN